MLRLTGSCANKFPLSFPPRFLNMYVSTHRSIMIKAWLLVKPSQKVFFCESRICVNDPQ